MKFIRLRVRLHGFLDLARGVQHLVVCGYASEYCIDTSTRRARFLYLCCGYYSYAGGHRPTFDGEADFQGRIVEPQFWPADLQHAGKQVLACGFCGTVVPGTPEQFAAFIRREYETWLPIIRDGNIRAE